MINHETANLKELFEELKKTKKELAERLKLIDKTYQEIINKIKENNKSLNLLKYYYESDAVNVVITNSTNILKIINNIMSSSVIYKAYINQLKSVAKFNRRNGLGDFKEEWLREFNNEDYSDIYKQACDIDDWISDCDNIAIELEGFIGDNNPLISNKQENEIVGKFIHDEEIILTILNIRIKGNRISNSASKLKKVFNPTEENIIYFLYYKFLGNPNECFKIPQIAKEFEVSEGNTKNRISNINKVLKNTISKNQHIKIELIKNESKRGYHFNPQLFKVLTKK